MRATYCSLYVKQTRQRGVDLFRSLQAMVPMWDALNHVTGRANVRLHHCERSSTLQMIATADISVGQEVLSCPGLSDVTLAIPIEFQGLQARAMTETGTCQTLCHRVSWPQPP